jgi:predicted RNase H-like HicB family nuclease
MPHMAAKIEALEKEIVLLKERVGELQDNAPLTLTVDNLAPEPLDIVLPFAVVVSCQGEEFVARWFDANVSASGATAEEAFLNLKDMVAALFEILSKHHATKLAKGPARQFQVLNCHIRKKP